MVTETAQDAYAELVESLDLLDETIHQKVRLGIMSIHLSKLEEAGYLASAKEFVRKKPHSTYTPTEAGRLAFHAYLAALERIVHSAGRSEG